MAASLSVVAAPAAAVSLQVSTVSVARLSSSRSSLAGASLPRLSLTAQQQAQPVSRCHVAAPRAAKRQDELVEIRGMSTADIEQQVVDLKGELFLLRAKQATRLEYKASEFGRIRKRIARMLTVRREREVEQSIGKRESRKLDYAWKQSIVPRPPPSYNPDDFKK